MERHKCKLCFRVFPNGRSLGGHMKSHMAKLRLPPISSSATTCRRRPRPDDDESSSSFSYSSSADPEFSFAGSSSVVQDRESETESRNPTRRRSKRTRKSGGDEKKGFAPPAAEQEPVSSVSDTSPEEDVAMCLVMLSRDVNWKGRFSYKSDEIEEEDEEEEAENGGEIKKRAEIEEEDQGIMKLKCEKCTKQFRSSQALGSHRRICSLNGTQLGGGGMGNVVAAAERIFRCPYCSKVFGSGQALGGHKRSHLNGGGSYPSPAAAPKIDKNYSFLDLNFPAPVEDDEFSVVSDA
ncbi:unnamed protein product [Linum tenue]|uniref:C2H2-type domain-containing protein n=1 Tax=Linum tenue TaxID=586396 RepID=A0AAV0JVI2_9ROSI|nr:unnamed protein product [Linum tenue]